jgi:hypothetical protein
MITSLCWFEIIYYLENDAWRKIMIGPLPFQVPKKYEPMFWLLDECASIAQRVEFHPEGDVLTHSIQAFKRAARESSDPDFITAALMHDVGKISGDHGHANVAVEFLACHCSEKTLWLIKNHMRIHLWLNGEMKKYKKIMGLLNHKWFKDLVHLARIDKSSRRSELKIKKYDKQYIVQSITGR